MPHPFGKIAIAAVHRQLAGQDRLEAPRIFSGGQLLVSPGGDNPIVLPLQHEEKILLGLTQYSAAYRVRIFGKGDSYVDGLCKHDRQWEISFDGGGVKHPCSVDGLIRPDASMFCWEFVLVRQVLEAA